MHARKTVSAMAAARDVTGWSAPPVSARPPNGFEPAISEHSGVKTLSWDELARTRDLDAETKNFKVPPELIELARSNRPARGRIEVRTPLAPKPASDVVVVVPPAPLGADLFQALDAEADSELDSAPPVAFEDPSGDEPIITFEEPVLEIAFGAGVSASKRAVALIDEAAPESNPEPSRLHAYRPFLIGIAVVSSYIALCYFANALIASLP